MTIQGKMNAIFDYLLFIIFTMQPSVGYTKAASTCTLKNISVHLDYKVKLSC